MMRKELKTNKGQQGIVLIITLLVLVAMMLVATAMIRSTDTAILAIGNMMTRQQAEGPVNFVVERVLNDYAPLAVGASPLYVQQLALAQDSRGIPLTLLGNTPTAQETTFNVPGNTDYTIRAVVEQMCRNGTDGNPVCMTGTGAGAGGEGAIFDTNMDGELTIEVEGGGGASAIVRITIRVDGPRNTVAFAQAFLS